MGRVLSHAPLLLATLGLSLAIPAAAQETGNLLEVIDDRERGELIFVIGPIELPANTGHHGIQQPPLQTGVVPVDAYLYGFDVEIVDGAGEPIPSRVLHHVNLIDPDHRELFSPTARRLFAAGQETQPASVPKVIGIPLEEGQRLIVTSMFHNPTRRGYPEAYLRVKLRYREHGWVFPIEVYPFYVDVMGPVGEKDFDLPPGRSEWSWEGRPAIDGRMLGIGGHVHKHAEVLRFEDVTVGSTIWEGRPVVDSVGRVVEVPVGHLWKRGGVRVRADHVYRLTAVYDNPTGDTIPAGGMGALGGIFVPGWGEAWPALDPTDPLYVADLRRTHEVARQRASASHGAASEGEHHGHSH